MVWAFDGAREEGDVRWLWDPIIRPNLNACKLVGDPRKPGMSLGLDPERCRDNQETIDDQAFGLLPKDGAATVAVCRSDREGKLRGENATAGSTTETLAAAEADALIAMASQGGPRLAYRRRVLPRASRASL